ncbi:MAG: protein BatD [Gammaproteobacteria bacterium]|nr:MAG: protein BatD [Gammaproteobacteria bacterium]
MISPYVQQQVRVTVKLFYALNLTDGNLEDPRGDGVNARKLGQDASYTAEVDGRRYKVLERHYALAAEKSGALALAPVTFRGHALNPNDLNSFFSRGRAVTAQAPALTLDVRARPPASGSDAWLPAQSLDLAAEGIDASTQARVGEPLTLTLRLKAQGLGFEQLPELKLPKIDGADVYPDKETTQNRDDGTWQSGERERKFAIVPNRPGALTIPALSLAWWDTAHDRAASAELVAHTLSVAAASADTRGADTKKDTSTPAPANARATASSEPVVTSNSADAGSGAWRMLAVAALGLWLVTLAAWIYTARRGSAARHPPHDSTNAAAADEASSIRAARRAFAEACVRDDASACARTLLAWARARGVSVRTLGELAQLVIDPSQRDALLVLERALYGEESGAAASTTGLGAQLARAFNQDIRLPVTARSARTPSPLPPLYPFVVRKDGTAGR